MRNKRKKFEWNENTQAAFENIKGELCEALVLSMPTEKGMYVLDTDASVVTVSEKLHQKHSPSIAYSCKVLSDTEMNYRAPKVEIIG